MGQLTTHVLDTAHGRPGTGMAVTLYRRAGDRYESIKSVTTNADGRVDAPLLEGDALSAGRYRLVFAAGAYFRRLGVALPDPPFVDQVAIDFGVADPAAHYHVPYAVNFAAGASPIRLIVRSLATEGRHAALLGLIVTQATLAASRLA